MEKNLINGTWFTTKESHSVYSPSTQLEIARVASATKEDVKRAIDSAFNAFIAWSELNSYERQAYLERIASSIDENRESLVDVLMKESGKTKQDCNDEVNASIASFKFYAIEGTRQYGKTVESREAHTIQMAVKKPFGVVALLTPWNFPLSLVARKLAPALAAGNTVILKPSGKTPLVSLLLSKLLNEILPNGVHNVITGESGLISNEVLSDDRVRKLSFTGSTRVGQLIHRKAADSMIKLSLELGGNAPFIVDESANLELTAELLIKAKIRSNGQVCIAPNRVFVHSNIEDKFMEILSKKVSETVVGNPIEAEVDLGPVIDENAVNNLNHLLEDALDNGATKIAIGKKHDPESTNKQYFPLTLISNVDKSMEIYHEEIFGPILSVIKFDDFESVVREANSNKFGLAGYLFTSNNRHVEYASNKLEVGMLGVNNISLSTPETPFGGIKYSGYGRENGTEGIEEYFELKFIKVSY